jgi:hypothetical protein
VVTTGITVFWVVTPSEKHSSVRCLEQAVLSETSAHLYQTPWRHISEYHDSVFFFIYFSDESNWCDRLKQQMIMQRKSVRIGICGHVYNTQFYTHQWEMRSGLAV